MPSRRLVVHGVLLLLLVVTASPVALGPPGSSGTPGLKAAIPSPTPSPSATAPPVEATPDGPAPLTLDMAVGQMMAASFGGPAITGGVGHPVLGGKGCTALIFRHQFTRPAGLAR